MAPLRRTARAATALFRTWSALLRPTSDIPIVESGGNSNAARDRVAILAEMATVGVWLRVASTVLHAAGEQTKTRVAAAVARKLMRRFDRARESANESIGRWSTIDAAQCLALDRHTARCERLSDLLCGAMLPQSKNPCFAVDSDRAADFANTFGRFPALVRVPVRRAAEWAPPGTLAASDHVRAVVRALSDCLVGLAAVPRAVPDPFTDLTEMFRPRILPLPTRSSARSPRPIAGFTDPLMFPSMSFAKLYARRRHNGLTDA